MEATRNTPPSGTTGPDAAQRYNSSFSQDMDRKFSLEALAPCLADLKRQLALRQAMA